MVACGKVDSANVGVHPIPPLTFRLVTAFNVLCLDGSKLNAVNVEVPVISYVISAMTCACRLKLNKNRCILSKTDGGRHLRALTDSTYGCTAVGGLTGRLLGNSLYEELAVLKTVCVSNITTCKCLFGIKVFKILNDCGSIIDLYNGVNVSHTYVEINVVEVKGLIALCLEGKSVSSLGNSYVTDNDVGPLTCTVSLNYVTVKRKKSAFYAIIILAVVKEHLKRACVKVATCSISYTENYDNVLILLSSSKGEAEVVPLYAVAGKVTVAACDVSVGRWSSNEAIYAFCLGYTGYSHINKLRLYTIRNGIVLLGNIRERSIGYFRNSLEIDRYVVTSGMSLINYDYLSFTGIVSIRSVNLAVVYGNLFGAAVLQGGNNLKTLGGELFTKVEYKLRTGSIKCDGFNLEIAVI